MNHNKTLKTSCASQHEHNILLVLKDMITDFKLAEIHNMELMKTVQDLSVQELSVEVIHLRNEVQALSERNSALEKSLLFYREQEEKLKAPPREMPQD